MKPDAASELPHFKSLDVKNSLASVQRSHRRNDNSLARVHNLLDERLLDSQQQHGGTDEQLWWTFWSVKKIEKIKKKA